MPALKMPTRQQEIYDELMSITGGAKMMSNRQIAQYWGRDDRAARKWVAEMGISCFVLNGIKRYSARDVSKAIYNCEA